MYKSYENKMLTKFYFGVIRSRIQPKSLPVVWFYVRILPKFCRDSAGFLLEIYRESTGILPGFGREFTDRRGCKTYRGFLFWSLCCSTVHILYM